MYKVFFVDDEAAMRAGVRENINWDTSAFTLAGEAPDGEMALSLMQDIMPDILITDVKMPFMDGIEFARQAKAMMPWVKIIILSGHDEFEYARQAITIGVEEYLLKPVTSRKLFETLDRVAAKMEEEKEKLRLERERILNMRDISMAGLIPVSEANRPPSMERLRYASKQEIPKLLDDYLNKFGEDVIESFIFMNYMFMDVISFASKVIEEWGGDPRRILSGYSDAGILIDAVSDVENAKKIMSSILETVIEFRDTITRSKYHGVIQKARAYIHKNYREQDISLHCVAEEVNISPNHFSTIFSQETGETFINYVTRVRIERAKILLKTTQSRTADIAYEVGYSDNRYFSYVFKKHAGMTPKEFRSAWRQTGIRDTESL